MGWLAMMIGDREVLQTQVGENVIYRKTDYSSVWYDCPDVSMLSENTGVTFNDGSSVMKYDETNQSITVKSDLLALSALTIKSNPLCLLQLPDGFTWGEGTPKSINLSSWQRVETVSGASTSSASITYDVTYDGDKLFVLPYVNGATTITGCGLTPKKWLGQGSDIKNNVVIPFGSSLELSGVYRV